MLPPGHIAAGYLVTEALLHFTHPALSQHQQNQLLVWGMFFAFSPDLDVFFAFSKVHAWWYKPGVDSSIHRQFYSHIPILWLIASLIIYCIAPTEYVKYVALLLWLCSWSHFLLDSIEYGVPWLWPFNKEVWALKDRGVKMHIKATSFFDYWKQMVTRYFTRWTFYAEIIILIVFVYVIR